MECCSWKEMIIDRLADELGEDDSILLEQHLAECPSCRQEEQGLAQLLRAVPLRQPWSADAATEGTLITRMRQLRAQRESFFGRIAAESAIRRRLDQLAALIRRPLPSYAMVSVLLVGVVGGFLLGQSGPGAQTGLVPVPAVDVRPSNSGPAGLPAEGHASFAVADTEMGALGFVPTYSDVIQLYGAIPPDSL